MHDEYRTHKTTPVRAFFRMLTDITSRYAALVASTVYREELLLASTVTATVITPPQTMTIGGQVYHLSTLITVMSLLVWRSHPAGLAKQQMMTSSTTLTIRSSDNGISIVATGNRDFGRDGRKMRKSDAFSVTMTTLPPHIKGNITTRDIRLANVMVRLAAGRRSIWEELDITRGRCNKIVYF
ncbi:10600_t:CDS:2 [Paraglomus occultum]|uniref:10600_t:CDS:1 n=1 Tax=Paraglomus occultum TaxID=144539 RepID=A0A9N9A9L0_9GLOM|nr:10600_t:CDS:2 [Paraglomus occultum]